MKNTEVKTGEHCWALLGEKLLVVLKVKPESYEVCGPWECGADADELELLRVIETPAGHEETKLYYLQGS